MPSKLWRYVNGQWVKRDNTIPPVQARARVHHARLTANAPVAPPATFWWGFQVKGTTADYMVTSQETPLQQYQRHMAVYGRNDICKTFYSGALPATFQLDQEGVYTSRKRAMVCHNTGGVSLAGCTAIANGQYDSLIQGYMRSVPAGWTVDLIWNQEMDSSLQLSEGGTEAGPLTKAAYKNAYNHWGDVIHADMAKQGTVNAVLKAGVTIYNHANFMNAAFRQQVWSDDRIPSKADIISWDTYMNPPPSPTSNPPDYEGTNANGYTWQSAASLHEAVAARVLDYQGNNFQGRWGWAEVGAPFRTNDTTSQVRADSYARMCDYLLATSATFGCLWDTRVGQWDHRIMDYTITPKPSATPIFQQGCWLGTPGALGTGQEKSIGVLRQKWGIDP